MKKPFSKTRKGKHQQIKSTKAKRGLIKKPKILQIYQNTPQEKSKSYEKN